MAINFQHTQTNLVKECPEGFSWTYFLFGPIVGILRGMWAPAAVSFLTFGLGNLYYMFKINKLYAVHLMEKGYKPASDIDQSKVISLGLMAPPSAQPVPKAA